MKLNERENIYLCSKWSCQEFEVKMRCYQEENIEKKNNEDWKNFLRSMIRNTVQWVF